MQSILKSLVSLASGALLTLFTVCAHAATLDVPSQYTTIQAAIDNAAPGDTIVVGAGTFHESLVWTGIDLTTQGGQSGPTILDPSVANGGPGGRCLYTQDLTSQSSISGFAFKNGSADTGGGMLNASSSPRFTGCIFRDNVVTYYGGGMFNGSDSNPVVTDCVFENNQATLVGGLGGGMINFYYASPTLINCTFNNNRALLPGGGLINFNSSNTTITNGILWGNSAPSASGLYNSGDSSCALSFSDVEDLPHVAPDADGNFAADPMFSDAATGDLRLKSGSPCIGVGTNSVVTSPPFLTLGGVIVDLNGNPRIYNGTVDLGAYESLENSALVVYDHVYGMKQDTLLTVDAPGVLSIDTDPDGDTLTASLVSGPASGTLNLHPDGSFTYMPASGFTGPVSFAVNVLDGMGHMSRETVTINVKPAPRFDPVRAIQALKAQVAELAAGGANLPANGNSLQVKLDAAITALQAHDVVAAKTALQDFINQVRAFIRTGRLTGEQGQPLINAADSILARL